MKQLTAVLLTALVFTMTVGCDRNEPENAQPFDPKVDAPASVLKVSVDANVSADQRQLARKMRKQAETDRLVDATPAAAKGPRVAGAVQTLKDAQNALFHGEKNSFVDCFITTGQAADVVGNMYDYLWAIKKLKKDMRRVSGGSDIRDFKFPGPVGLLGNDWLTRVKVQEDGDRATATNTGWSAPVQLVKSYDVWKITVTSIPDLQGIGSERLAAMAKAVEDASAKIGRRGQTPRRILADLRSDLGE